LYTQSGKFDGTVLEYNGEDCQIIRDDNVLLLYEGVTLRYDNAIPVRDYVLVKLDNDRDDPSTAASQRTTESGIVIAGQSTRDLLPCEGVVVKVGVGRMSATGALTQSPVQVGDRIKFKDYAGNDIMIEGKKYSVVKMVDILATYVGDKKK
jgi:chaperonin GroES